MRVCASVAEIGCCLIKLLPYILFEKYIYILSNENGQSREPALCQLYRHTFFPYIYKKMITILPAQLPYTKGAPEKQHKLDYTILMQLFNIKLN